VILLHLVLLGVAVLALGALALRWAASLTASLAGRLLGAVALGGGLAVAESLLLGLAAQGTNPWLLPGVAAVAWAAGRATLPAPAPPVRAQVEPWCAIQGAAGRAVVGGFAALVAGITTYQLFRPSIGDDGLTYHSAQPAVWMASGRPGSLHETLSYFPTQAYPKTMEVLLSWCYSIGRSLLAAVPLTIGLSVLLVASVVVALRRLGVAPWLAWLAAAAGFLVPLDVKETSGTFSDLPAMAWLACAVALCLVSRDDEQPGLLGAAAVAGGLAVGTKPTSLPFLVVALGWAAWSARGVLRTALRRLAVPSVLALGLGAVWYVQDWVVYGSPLWPFTRFPAGRPVPLIWQVYGARFLSDPVASYHSVGAHSYFLYFGGGLVLIAAPVVVAAAAWLPGGRTVRRATTLGAVAVVAATLLWSASQFTGLAGHNPSVVLTGFRYLLPVPVLGAAVLALAARSRSLGGRLAVALLGAALVLDVVELRLTKFSFPFRPAAPALVAMVVVGALAAAVLRELPAVSRLAASRFAVPVLVLAIAAAMTLPASRYVHNYLSVAADAPQPDAKVVSYLSQQPGWVHGDAPVAAGYAAYVTLAGPRFSHRLTWVPNSAPCAEVRAAAQRGWLVMPRVTRVLLSALQYTRAPACLAGIAPVAKVGNTRIYAPPSLVRR
jgi:hypothetical protein